MIHKQALSIFVLTVFLVMSSGIAVAQRKSSYTMEFVRAVQLHSGETRPILAFVKVAPTIKDFRLVMSGRVTYQIGDEERIVDVQNKKDNVSLDIYDQTIATKNPKLYDLIKDRLQVGPNEYLIVFNFQDVTTTAITDMSIKYGLWESNNVDVRNEKKFQFKVEQLD